MGKIAEAIRSLEVTLVEAVLTDVQKTEVENMIVELKKEK